jgi:hypothetical protein
MKVELRKEDFKGEVWYYIYVDNSIVFGSTKYQDAVNVYNDAKNYVGQHVKILATKEIPA